MGDTLADFWDKGVAGMKAGFKPPSTDRLRVMLGGSYDKPKPKTALDVFKARPENKKATGG